MATCLASPPKVIIDTDFNTISDDGQVAVMAAQLYAQGTIDLLGFTIASGNQWRDQEVSDCLKAVERLGIEHLVRVHVGAQYPLLHDYKDYLYEEQLFGPPIDYVGAYASPQPLQEQLCCASAAMINRAMRQDAEVRVPNKTVVHGVGIDEPSNSITNVIYVDSKGTLSGSGAGTGSIKCKDGSWFRET